jgi:hypothetical protein
MARIAEATQGLNRYSYVLNNPMSATDPSGNFSLRQALGAVVGIVAAIVSQQYWALNNLWASFGVAVGGGFASAAIATGSLKAGLWGAVSAAAFWGIGTAFSKTTTTLVQRSPGIEIVTSRVATGSSIAKVAAHAITGGTLTQLQGGKFGHGFVAAGFTEALSPAVGQLGEGSDFGTVLAKTAVSAAIGGTASKLSGGNFANGAQTGAFQQLFNSAVHAGKKSESDNLPDSATIERAKNAVDLLWFNPNNSSDTPFFESLVNWQKPAGEFVLAGHGDENMVIDTSSGTPIYYAQADAAAWEIEHHPNYKNSTHVRLLSCNTGFGGVKSFAQAWRIHLGDQLLLLLALCFSITREFILAPRIL